MKKLMIIGLVWMIILGMLVNIVGAIGCVPGKSSCNYANIQVCKPDGSGYLAPVPCPEGQYCNNGVCEVPKYNVCTPWEFVCEDLISSKQCAPDGSGYTPLPCYENEICKDGACVEQQQQKCIPTPTGLISWWPGEDNAKDIINQNNGELLGNAVFVEGKVGKAFSFDGDGDYVKIPHKDNLNLNEYTIEAWVKPNKIDDFYHAIVGKGLNPVPPTLYLMSQQIRVWYSIDNVADLRLYSQNLIKQNLWSHLAVTYDGAKAILYVNGKVVNTDFLAAPDTNANDLYIGYDGPSGKNPGYFNGLIDEVSMYNRALSANEIKLIYDFESKGKCVPKQQICTPDQWYCDDNDARKQCKNDGTGYLPPVNCGQGEICENGVCKAQQQQVCTPDQWYCDDNDAKKQCKNDGTGYLAPEDCGQGEVCENGNCKAQQQQPVAVCGDGKIEGNEKCDDKNNVFNDGCVDCQIEGKEWSCSGEPSICKPIPQEGICSDLNNLQPNDKSLAVGIINALKNNEYSAMQKLNAIVMALKAWLS